MLPLIINITITMPLNAPAVQLLETHFIYIIQLYPLLAFRHINL